MKTSLSLLAVFLVFTTGARAAETIVSEEELKAVAQLVELQKAKFSSGSGNQSEVYDAERLHLRAQYWAGKLTKKEFIEKADLLHKRSIQLLKEKIASGVMNNTELLKAYENMFADRKIE